MKISNHSWGSVIRSSSLGLSIPERGARLGTLPRYSTTSGHVTMKYVKRKVIFPSTWVS